MAPSKSFTKGCAQRSKLKRKRQTAKATEALKRKRAEVGMNMDSSSMLGATPTAITDIEDKNVRVSASKRKLSFFSEQESFGSALPSTYVYLESLQSLFTGLQCATCHSQCLQLKTDESKNCGLAVYLQVFCNTCEEVRSESFTSPKSDRVHTVNRQAVAASLATGMGYAGLVKFSEMMNSPVLHQKSYNQHTKEIHKITETFSDRLLAESNKIVRAAYPEQSGREVCDIDVSYDGTWQTRGHKSKYGVGCVIECRTGLVVDFAVMSKYCHKCSTTGSKLKTQSEEKFKAWYEAHKTECDINHLGSSGSMEQQAAVKMWARSMDKHQLRYRSVISDGDTNTIKAIHQLGPYQDLTVEKRECVNHVAKKLGTALRNVVDAKKKEKVTLGGNGRGKLTQSKIAKLQKYFTKALRSSSSVPQMRKAIWATYHHCSSTDEEPKHQDCPEGASSWCFFQRAAAQGLPTPQHEKMVSSYICPLVAEHIHAVYERMTHDDLLHRCLDGKTQNVNESIHALIWSRCPKHLFVGRQRLEVAVSIGVGEFNMGSKATRDFLGLLNLHTGSKTYKLGMRRDAIRVSKAQKSLISNEVFRRKVRRVAEEKERSRIELEEGGPQYLPGGADV